MTTIARIILFITFLCLGNVSSFAQYTQKIDSLKKLLQSPQHDTLRVFRLNEIAKFYNLISPDTSLIYTNEAIALAQKAGYLRGLGRAHVNTGISYDNLGKLEEALAEFAKAKAIYEKTPYKKEISPIYTNSGIVYHEMGKYDSAISCYEQSLQYKDSTNAKDLESIGIVYTNMAVVYYDLGDWDKSLEYSIKSRAIARRVGDKQGIADNDINMGNIYKEQGQLKKALEMVTEAQQLQVELEDKEGLCYSLEAIGNIHCQNGNFKEALDYLNKALAVALEMKLLLRVGTVNQSLGDCYASQKDHAKAIFYYNKSLEVNKELGDIKSLIINHVALGNLSANDMDVALKEFGEAARMAEETGYLEGLEHAYQGMANAYEKKGDYKNASAYFVKQSVVKDSLHNKDETQHLMRLQIQYETEKKDQEIALLNTKSALQESENRKQRLLRNAFVGGFAALLAFTLLLVYTMRRKQRMNALLTEKTGIIRKQKIQVENAIEELQASQIQLVQAEKMAALGQLTAGVAHEINNPINFVSGSITPLKRNIDELMNLLEAYATLDESNYSGKLREILKMKDRVDLEVTIGEIKSLIHGIEIGSKRTAEIVKSLRNFSRLDEDELKKASINEGLETTLLLLHNKLENQNIEVVKSLGEIPLIDCYPGQLNQVFMNLLTNSIDAVGAGSKIFVTTFSENTSVKISIRDTGSGMSEKVKKKLFDPFFTTKDVGKGTGLGLSISYGIIKKHRGKIDVNSEVGKGTEFVITLPVV